VKGCEQNILYTLSDGNSLTSNSAPHLNDLRECEPVTTDAACDGPLSFIIDGSSNNRRKVRDRRQSHNRVLVSIYHYRTSVLKVEDGLQLIDILRGLVWEG